MRVKPKQNWEYLAFKYIIDELATIEGATTEEVYDKCLEWLTKIDAYVTNEEKPNIIQAVHNPRWQTRWGYQKFSRRWKNADKLDISSPSEWCNLHQKFNKREGSRDHIG